MFAQVIINSNVKQLDKEFSYNIPLELEEKIKIGDRVLVPFGRSKKLEEGFVINFIHDCEFETKDIAKIIDGLKPEQIKMAEWISKRYFCNLAEAIKLMLPPGTTSKDPSKHVKEKVRCFAKIKNKEKLRIAVNNFEIKSEKQMRIINFLLKNGETEVSDLLLFADTTRAVLKNLQKKGFIEINEKQINRNPIANKTVEQTNKLIFTEEQLHAYNEVEEAMEDGFNTKFLLFGVTGSRKNRGILTIDRKGIKTRKR